MEDPFVNSSPDPQRHRYSGFNAQQFSLYSNGSPSQVKRALEAHLSETDRRLNEASNVGTVLLKQRQDLHDRIKEIERFHSNDEISPELRQRLSQLEREVSEVSKETARIFVPKSRVPSGESADTSDSAVLSSQAQHSPSKIHAPSRKSRNQAPTRVNDVKLATDISDHLLNQLRELQAAYAEKDEAWKEAMVRKGELEADMENLRQRVRILDESEQRFKDENWSLETQLQNLTTAEKESADRAHKLTQTLNATKAEQAVMQREYEDLKQAHSKLSEDHTTTRKQNDSEISILRRNAAGSESEITTLHKKLEDLTSQNKELAKAFAAKHREAELAAVQGFRELSGAEDDGQVTPDPSPPPSPSKATPRHGALESETLKSSLLHAQRQIQHLKNIIHREKTEKVEMKRMLQDTRDELENKRKGVDLGAKKKNLKPDVSKKTPRADRLGAARGVRDEIIEDDEDWEDNDMLDTPSKSRPSIPGQYPSTTDNTDAYNTATEGSEAFETANENEASTETDAFQTTNETLDGNSEDDLTETEATPHASQINKKKSPMNRYSFQSTASTSGDEIDEDVITTPVSSQPKYKLRLARAGKGKGSPRVGSDGAFESPSTIRGSPASTASASGTPNQGRSLFAELGDLSDGETEHSITPQSAGVRSQVESPELSKRTPLPSRLRAVQSFEAKPIMVDSSTMTNDLESDRTSAAKIIGAGAVGAAVAGVVQHHVTAAEEPTIELAKELERTVVRLTPSAIISQHIEPLQVPIFIPQPPALRSSAIVSQHTQPLEVVPSTSPLSTSSVSSQHTVPVHVAKALPPPLSLSKVSSKDTEPLDEPKTAIPALGASSVVSRGTEPLLVVEDSVFNLGAVSLTQSRTMTQETIPYTPADAPNVLTVEQKEKTADSRPESKAGTPAKAGFGILGSMFKRGKSDKEPIIVAEDTINEPKLEASQVDGLVTPVARETRVPFQAIDGNAQLLKPTPESSTPGKLDAPEFRMLSESTQTMLSADDIDKLFKNKVPKDVPNSPGGGALFGSTSPRKGRDTVRRPGSSGSNRSTISPPPPLPAEAKQVIAAATQRTSMQAAAAQPSAVGSMGPPLMPASAYNKPPTIRRPRTPSISSPTRGKANVGVARSGVSSPVTRRSSVSSFASELDQRFNIGTQQYYPQQPGTDPRMIQALTQTMIGEHLWKYTRKAGREEFSSSRHRRYFWVHPYTRTLYWSEKDPSSADRSELKAKSIPIESVRVITDENPNPPGLYHKSIIVQTPGRPLKFTAPTSQRHETWFNALAYLLQRAEEEEDQHNDVNTDQIMDFDPNVRSSSRATGRSRASVSSYTSRVSAQRNASPGRQYPTLRPNNQQGSAVRSHSAQPHASSSSVSSRFSTMFRTPQGIRSSFSSRHSKASLAEASNEEGSVHSGAERKNSAEDMRKTMVASEKQPHLMEDVRACCDGMYTLQPCFEILGSNVSKGNIT